MADLTAQAQARFEVWRASPRSFVLENFEPVPTLDSWQAEGLDLLPTQPRQAKAACKGPGKTTWLALAAWWLMACHLDCQGEALAVTKDNLRDNLWKELGVWYQRSPLLQAMFIMGPERIKSRERPDTWFLAARSYAQDSDPKAQAAALSGLHAEWCFYLLDEAGEMSPSVVDAAKGIFSVSGQHGWVLVAGNRNTQSGALHYIETEDAASWHVATITGDPDDPKCSSRVDKDYNRAEIAKHGRDDPWVMVNILGLYPPVASDQRIALDDVLKAMDRDIPFLSYRGDARIWGVDPAYSDRSGADDAALARRQGVLLRPLTVWHGLDGPQLANRIGSMILEAERDGEKPDRIFVDKGGVGASCYDHLRLLGYDDLVIGVDFGGSSDMPEKYADKSSEMFDSVAEWVKTACLPQDPKLKSEMVCRRWGVTKKGNHTVFKAESKTDMRRRGVRSPNLLDAVGLTFAGPVMRLSAEEAIRAEHAGTSGKCRTEYDPMTFGG